MRDNGRPDQWTKKAKASGYAARSVFKLEEIHRREKVIPKKGAVLDLGCCPGSWSHFVKRTGGRKISLFGLDISDVPDYPGQFIQGSAFDISSDELLEFMGGKASLVMSDMAQRTMGHRFSDHIKQIELARAALKIGAGVLRPGGNFLVKVFDGEDAPAFTAEVRSHFAKVRRFKPDASRRESVEFFLVGLGFRGKKT